MVSIRPLVLLSILSSAAVLLTASGAYAQQPALPSPSGAAPGQLASLQPPEAQPPAADEQRRGRGRLALRIGGAGPYYSGILAGLDVTLPRAGMAPGWVGRVDLDNWGISILGSSTSATALTFSQISSTAGRVPDLYYGLGLGVVRMSEDDKSDEGLAGKVILGLNLGGHLALEGNILVGGGVTNSVGTLRLRF